MTDNFIEASINGRPVEAELLDVDGTRITPEQREERRQTRRTAAGYQRRAARVIRKAAKQAIRGRTDKAGDTLVSGLVTLLIEAALTSQPRKD